MIMFCSRCHRLLDSLTNDYLSPCCLRPIETSSGAGLRPEDFLLSQEDLILCKLHIESVDVGFFESRLKKY
jgi:hypothetical protein